MKKRKINKFLCVTAVMLAVLFCFVACDKPPSGNGGVHDTPPDDEEDPYVIELIITQDPIKIEYMPGERLDTTGMALVAKWSHLDDDGNNVEEDISPDECVISPNGQLAPDDTQITFTYEGVSAVLNIVMNAGALVNVTFDDSRLSKSQLPGIIDLTAGITATAHYEGNITAVLSEFDIFENDIKIENPRAYDLTAGTHTFTAKYQTWESGAIIVTAVGGYTVDSVNIVYSEVLAGNRDKYIGTNFVENPAPARYAKGTDEQIISSVTVSNLAAAISTDPDGVISKYVKYTTQGNDPTYSKQAVDSDGNDVGLDTYSAGIQVRGSGSGTEYVPCLQEVSVGHIMRYHIYSELETDVELILNAASANMIRDGGGWNPLEMGDMQFNRVFKIHRVSVDPETDLPVTVTDEQSGETVEVKTEIIIDDYVTLPGSKSATPNMDLWANFVDVSFGELTLQKGDNIFELEIISDYKNCYNASCAANIGDFKVLMLPEDNDEHDLVKINGTPATCTDTGTQTYWRCSICSRTFADAAATERIYNAPIRLPVDSSAHVPGAAATCGTAQVCTRCNVELAPATGEHTPSEAANCLHNQVCTVCGRELAPIGDHTYAETPTCGATAECMVCKQTLTVPHSEISLDGETYKCGVCDTVVGYRYIIQAEDGTRVTFENVNDPEIKEHTVPTNTNWGGSVFDGAMGKALIGIEPNERWSKDSSLIKIKINIPVSGAYDIGLRCQTNSNTPGNKDISESFAVSFDGGSTYDAVSGTVYDAQTVMSSGTHNWSRTYNWTILNIARAQLEAGEHTVILKYIDSGRAPNIDYFTVNTAGMSSFDEPTAQVVLTNGEPAYTVGKALNDGVLESVFVRIKVPADKVTEVGCEYRDICVTDEIITAGGGVFDTSSAGEKSVNLKVDWLGEIYEVTFDYTVAE